MKSLVGRSWVLAAAASLALFTTSCASTSPETDAQVESPVTGGSTEDTETGQSSADFVSEKLDGELVANFPAEVPLYPGEILSSSSALSEVIGEPAWSVVMTTTDPLDTVDAAIREAFSTNGWTIGSDMEFGGGYQLVARGGGPTTSITYNDMLGPFTITYGVGG